MGLASSQGRLLSITARLTSNEYESQQISNAKMRLATQSQKASEAYIEALNSTEYTFLTYDSTGNTVNTPLTVASLYEYAENKNQYILSNNSGKVLLSTQDQEIYKSSPNLMAYLKRYGVEPTFKTETLKEAYEAIYGANGSGNGLIKWANYFDFAKEEYSKGAGNFKYYDETGNLVSGTLDTDWLFAKETALYTYLLALNEYSIAANEKAAGEDVTNADMVHLQIPMENAREEYTRLISFESAKEAMFMDLVDYDKQMIDNDPSYTPMEIVVDYSYGSDGEIPLQDVYKNYMEYKNQVAIYKDELDKLNLTPTQAYYYEDQEKAQWYTNLWYKINGPSTDNSGLNNFASLNAKDGIREFKDGEQIASNDSTLLNSSVWISNALAKGYASIEKASYSNSQMTLKDSDNPFTFNLHGISWNGKIYSSVEDIIESRDDKAIAQAEAEYQRKTTEINAKDEKYQRQLNLLDTEHNAMQTEYESVKNAMNKNMERSFKAFQG